MTEPGPRRLLQMGEPAPDFTLPAVNHDGMVSLADYRGRSPLLLALFRGMYCPFCRRAIAQLGMVRDRLQELGVETLGIVATSHENARRYFRLRPTRVALAADSDLTTHQAFGLPKPALTPELLQAIQVVRINPSGELPEPLPAEAAAAALDRLDGFQPTPIDHADAERQFPQLKGQFLVDRDGLVRWMNVECSREGLAGLGKFPSADELVAAARAVVG